MNDIVERAKELAHRAHSGQDQLDQRAREFLARQYDLDGKHGSAEHIRTAAVLMPNKARAVRAIAEALGQNHNYQ